MRLLSYTAFLFLMISCSRNQDTCRLKAIQHGGSLGIDTLFYSYQPNGEIDHVSNVNGTVRYQYTYSNSRVSTRALYLDGQLVGADSAQYAASGDLLRFVRHQFARPNNPESRSEVQFYYQNGRVIRTLETNTGWGPPRESSFQWTQGNITSIVQRSGNYRDSVLLAYSGRPNPFRAWGAGVLLLDPSFEFFKSGNLRRLAFLLSEQAAESGYWYMGNGATVWNIEIHTEGNGRLSSFMAAPSDEFAAYLYDCP